MKLKTNLTTLMLRHGNISVSDLAKATGLPQPTLHQLYSGATTRPHQKTLNALAEFFSVDVDALIGLVPLPEQWPKHLKIQLNLQTTPLIEWHELPLWPEGIALDKKPALLLDSQDSPHTFALRMNDSSMEPLFPLGTLLIFDAKKTLSDRDCALIHIHQTNHFVFKRMLLDGGMMYAKSINPELRELPLLKINPKDKIVGVLLEARIKF